MGDTSDWPPEYPYRRSCFYCESKLKAFRVSVLIKYQIPIPPPPGARDLGFKETKEISADIDYFACPKCGAKYMLGGEWKLRSVSEFWDKNALLDKYKKGLPQNAKIIEAKAENYGLNQDFRYKQYGDCFIATAVYGSYDAPEVRVLRKFRDRFLLKSLGGRLFVSFYYWFSPGLVKYLEGKERIKISIKETMLDPLVTFLSKKL